MIMWSVVAIMLSAYTAITGKLAVMCCIGIFFCGANFGMKDLERIQAPMIARLRKLLDK